VSDPTVILYDGATDYDISAQVQSVSFKRGRTRELDTIEPATGTINLINYDRSFDPPSYNGDTSYGTIVPGMRVEIFDGAVQVFAGYVLDWDHRWRNTKESTASIYITDALGTLAGTTFTEHQATDLQDAGARITEGLDRAEVGFPSGAAYRDINPGLDPLQGDIVPASTNVLNRFQLIAQSDRGRLYVTRDGVLTYRNRHDTLGTDWTTKFSDAESPVAVAAYASASAPSDATVDVSSFADGVLMVGITSGNLTMATPSGWTAEGSIVSGTVNLYVYTKVKSGDTSVLFDQSGPNLGVLALVVAFSGSSGISLGSFSTVETGGITVPDSPTGGDLRCFVYATLGATDAEVDTYTGYPSGYVTHAFAARTGAANRYRIEVGSRSTNAATGFSMTDGGAYKSATAFAVVAI